MRATSFQPYLFAKLAKIGGCVLSSILIHCFTLLPISVTGETPSFSGLAMDSLMDKWHSFSILENEGDVISVPSELVEEGRQLVPVGLVGKLLSKRFINKNNFCRSLKQIWNINSRMDLRVLTENTFLFTFEEAEDVDRILASEPWSYNRALLVLKKFEGFPKGDVGTFQTFQIWVRAYNIPVEVMFSDIAMFGGDDIGVAIKADTDQEGRCLGTCMRIRVLLDVNKALRRVARISLEPSSPNLVVGLRYERLPDYCYSCGILGHVAKECLKYPFQKDIAYMEYLFGPWLRAEVELPTDIIAISDNPGTSSMGYQLYIFLTFAKYSSDQFWLFQTLFK